MLAMLAPWITSAAALAQVATVRKHALLGFAIGLAIQPVWVAFSIQTGQWGFLLATFGFVAVNAWNLRAAWLDRRFNPKDGWSFWVADGHVEEEVDG
jgi:hypothetical protein